MVITVMKALYESLGGTYREENGVFLPNLELPEQPNVNIGKYGQMRLDFLKKHRRGTYTTLLTEFLVGVGKHISAERKRQSLSQLQLSELAGISDKYLSNIECGRQNPSSDVLLRISEALQVSVDRLLPLNLTNRICKTITHKKSQGNATR